MKLALVVGSLIALTVLRCDEARAQTPAAPHDFGFRFEFGVCTTDLMDTFANTFTLDVNSDQHRTTSVSLVLPASLMQEIYAALVDAHFFESPSVFRDDGDSVVFPSEHYRFEVRSSGMRYTVFRRLNAGPSTVREDRLRSLFRRLEAEIWARPEIQQRFSGIVVACA